MTPSTPQAEEARRLHLVLIEDSPSDARLLNVLLAEATDIEFEVREASTMAEGVAAVAARRPDLVLLDLGLPDSQGLASYEEFRDQTRDVPVVIISGQSDAEAACEAVQLGAQDYLVKGEFMADALIQAIRYAVSRATLLRVLEGEQVRQVELQDQFLSHLGAAMRQPLALAHERLTFLSETKSSVDVEARHECLQQAIGGIRQLEAMMGEFLDARAVAANDLDVFPLSESARGLVDEAIDAVTQRALAKGVFIQRGVGAEIPGVWADRARVRQVLINLLHDAVYRTPPGREVQIMATAAEDAAMVRFTVRDSVSGALDLEQEPPAGEPVDLDQAQSVAAGAATLIARRTVQHHFGRMWVESGPGRSWATSFALPVFDARRAAHAVVNRAVDRDTGLVVASIELRHHSGATSRAIAGDLGARIFELLRSCSHMQDDRIMPVPSPFRDVNLFAVFMATDTEGAKAFRSRVEEQIGAIAELEGLEYDCMVETQVVREAISPWESAACEKELAARIGKPLGDAVPS